MSNFSIELMDDQGWSYHNAYDFAEKYEVEPEEVIFALNNGIKIGRTKKTHVYPCSEKRIFNENIGRLMNPGEHMPSSRWEIHNVDTDAYYVNGADCAKKIGVSRAMVSMCLSGKRKTCGGFRLERCLNEGDIFTKVKGVLVEKRK